MPRPKALHPKVKVHVSLRQETLGRVMLRIASPDHEYGFAKGALSDFIEAAVEEKLHRTAEAAKCA